MGDNREMPKKANNYITISYKVHLISVSESDTEIVFHRGTGSGHNSMKHYQLKVQEIVSN